MASQLRVRKEIVGGRQVLVPATPWDEEGMSAIPRGQEFTANLTRPSSKVNPHGKFYAGLTILVHNFDDTDRRRWPTMSLLRDALLEAVGCAVTTTKANGAMVTVGDNERFKAMEKDEADIIIEAIRFYVLKRWGYDPWAQWEQQKDQEKEAAKALRRTAYDERGWGPPPARAR